MSEGKSETAAGALPGELDRTALVDRMLRVDHAGEFGAQRIYAGQLAVLGNKPAGAAVRHMKAQEDRHLAVFETLLVERRARPTALYPLWHLAGFALGAGSALLGEKAAMACTVAVEEVIDQHYARQAAQLGDDEAELRKTIQTFRDEEIEHRDTAVAHGGREAPGYPVLSRVIRGGCGAAIWLSERI